MRKGDAPRLDRASRRRVEEPGATHIDP
jgi:hypothetical protein